MICGGGGYMLLAAVFDICLSSRLKWRLKCHQFDRRVANEFSALFA